MQCICVYHLFLYLVTNSTLKSGDELGDLYVFAYSWTPEFCYGESYPGCADPNDYWKTHFTIHGLWPQFQAGGYPSYCTDEAFDPAAPEAVGWDTMVQYWPDVQYAEDSSDYDQFWEHEWTKHGTCSGLEQEDYFQAAIDLIKSFGTPSSVTEAVGSSVDADTVRDDMGGASKASLQCESGKYLNGVYTCWTRNSDGSVGSQVSCPSDVQGEDTCSSSSVSVTAL